MKRTLLAVFLLAAFAVSGIITSGEPSEKAGCPCTGSPYTVVVCFEPSCPGPVPGYTRVALIDDDCGATVATCNISGSSPCCTITMSACSNHKFHVTYQQSGGLCSTGSFTLTGSPDTVLIPCYCP